ncbi:Oidioi.mRNA.OKI2018_I69.XSR.g16549.t2.cds [Oikopleura dioica]|uniref:Oidioi.mRNA.OKI2018_I69.XSR.g16549.t2.cds n=1 Tax=Oikopleura dioica TaxID=34765 RepID=A0ABN7SGG5_OIKDI|nr:Oidioi.mRNA.OKI2018_I69.XSR.g16549.t2.cds [Oikopleura dioica]
MSWRPPSRIDPRKPARDQTKSQQEIYQERNLGRRENGYALPRELHTRVFRDESSSTINSFSTRADTFYQPPSTIVDLDNFEDRADFSQFSNLPSGIGARPGRISQAATYISDGEFSLPDPMSQMGYSHASIPRDGRYQGQPSLPVFGSRIGSENSFQRKRKNSAPISTCVITGKNNNRSQNVNRSASSSSHRIRLDLTIDNHNHNASESIDLTGDDEEEEEELRFMEDYPPVPETPKDPPGPIIQHERVDPMKFLPFFDQNLGVSSVLKSKNKNIVKFNEHDEIKIKVIMARVEVIDGTTYLRDPYSLSDTTTTTIIATFDDVKYCLRHQDLVMLTDVRAEYKLAFDTQAEPTMSVHKIIFFIHEQNVVFSAYAQPFEWKFEPGPVSPQSFSRYQESYDDELQLPDAKSFNEEFSKTRSAGSEGLSSPGSSSETQEQGEETILEKSTSNDFDLSFNDAHLGNDNMNIGEMETN